MNTELYTLLDYAFGQAGFTVTGEMHSGLLVSHKSTRYAVPKLKKTYLGAPISLDGDGRVTAQAPFAMPILAEGWGTND